MKIDDIQNEYMSSPIIKMMIGNGMVLDVCMYLLLKSLKQNRLLFEWLMEQIINSCDEYLEAP